MEMSGEQQINAPRDAVWAALNDPDVLRQCIPGADEVIKTSDTEFNAAVTAKIGPVKAKFKGVVSLSDIDPPNGYRISGEGKGGAAGFGKGEAQVALAEVDGGTLLQYHVKASVGGKLAQLGSRLIDGVAKKMADDFFTTFKETVSSGAAEPTAAEPAAEAAPAAQPASQPAPQPAPQPAASPAASSGDAKGGMGPRIWIPLLIIVIAVIIWMYYGQSGG